MPTRAQNPSPESEVKIGSIALRLLSQVGTALRAVRCFAARPEVIALPLPKVRTRSQRSGTRFTYTRMGMRR